MWDAFLALPNYLGGKRRLAPTIFQEIGRIYPVSMWTELTLLDPCAGACSVCLYAKAQGMRVIAGDIAERSHLIQQALIVNSTSRLGDEDLGLLFLERDEHPRFAAENFVPAHFPSGFADFLDLALANIVDHPSETKRALLRLILYKMMKAPRIQFSDTTISRAIEEDSLEDLASHKAKMAERWYLTPPAINVRRLARVVNAAVFFNGHDDHEAHLADARDLVVERAGEVDILYLDPPYPQVTGYETYWVLDSVLAGQIVRPKRSLWSTDKFTLQLLSLLEEAQEIPMWILSYGSVGVTLEYLLDLVEEYRPARALSLPMAHLQAIARPEVAEANREYLIIAKKEG